MRSFFAWLGLALFVLGCAFGVAEVLSRLLSSGVETYSLGVIWSKLHANSLVGLQSAIENALSPALWPPVFSVLLMPAWLALPIPGLLLMALGRSRRDRGGLV